ncbi:ribosomal protein S5 domain 2-type protein [Xylogone sp. PMI_703]|nr:ribosomal protein S5 domain 2-type protein [Xylogone sp. PMI_703]
MKVALLPLGLREGIQRACITRPVRIPCLQQRTLAKQWPKPFSTSSQLRAGIAAQEIDFKKIQDGQGNGDMIYARLVPTSPSYFTAMPTFTDDYLSLQRLLERYASLPTVEPSEAPQISWRTLAEYKDMLGEAVKSAKYRKIIHILQRLNRIHPTLMPPEVKDAINLYKRDINPAENVPNPIKIDRFGRAMAHGKRKSSTARAWVVEGSGEVLVNGKTLAEAFGRVHDRESAIWPLKVTDRLDKYNVWVLVEGGGTTGQAEAITLAVAKALLAHEPALKPALRRAGCVTRDPRRVERKKPGHLKARKMPTWVKR